MKIYKNYHLQHHLFIPSLPDMFDEGISTDVKHMLNMDIDRCHDIVSLDSDLTFGGVTGETLQTQSPNLEVSHSLYLNIPGY